MVISEIQNVFSNSKIVQQIVRDFESEKKIYVKGLAGSLKAIFLSYLSDSMNRPVVYITGEGEQEEIVKNDVEVLLGHAHVAYFPKMSDFADKKALFDSWTKSHLLSGFEKLMEMRKSVSIVSAKNLVQKFPSRQSFKNKRLFLEKNKEIDFERFKELLTELGFVRENIVENWGEMSIRGGIIDVFPYSSEFPCRIEFFANSVESIRLFDPTTQRSLKQLPTLAIYPQFPEDQGEFSDSKMESFFDFYPENTIFFIDEVEIIKREVDDFFQFGDSLEDDGKKGELKKEDEDNYLSWNTVLKKLDSFSVIFTNSFQNPQTTMAFDFEAHNQELLKGNFKLLKEKIAFFQKQKQTRVFFLCENSEQVERIEELFSEENIDLENISLLPIGLNSGFVFNKGRVAVFTDNQFFGRPIRWRRRKKIKHGLTIQQINSLSLGDFVVHVDKGVGRYQGLKKIRVREHERECLKVEYRGGDFLYVPLEKMDRVQKYSAKDGVIPALSKLGGADWERLKKSTKKHIKEIAKELTTLYAKRKMKTGFAFSKDSLWQKELEASFEYDDTPDQKRATEEIKKDMEALHPMDRLVCGDVGYGKTEVAVRASFKAVNSGKQVAVLVPTTILALQHYDLFRERLKEFPVNIEMLSRFRTTSQQKRVVEKLQQGKIDIVIGTHRLLSNDIHFKKLGLLVIDEEHRFGVRKKEELKKKYTNVDVLSMSATPIPRTLNMAMLGIRDMSLITTPPNNRQPIYTEIAQFNMDIIRAAILKEADRGGQVFFVHNRVRTIESMANLIRKHVPEINVAVAHGQMDEKQLEKVMWDFATKKYHCLVSTMIIESGLDIPNVNTLIINRADRFGLSQLYQLRGRVGRSTQRAFAYLLIPSVKSLTRDSLKRLRIIEEFTDLGAGFNIAMRDLEIRGAGNILGAQQSGHIVALGFDLYTRIIDEAVKELKMEQEGKPISEKAKLEEVRVEFAQDAFLPDDYINHPEFKVDIYRRLANETDLNEIYKIKEEIQDRFGKMPVAVLNLFDFIELKLIGQEMGFKRIKIDKQRMSCYFSDELVNSKNRELIENKISRIIKKASGAFQFSQGKNEDFGIQLEIPDTVNNEVEYSKNFLEKLL